MKKLLLTFLITLLSLNSFADNSKTINMKCSYDFGNVQRDFVFIYIDEETHKIYVEGFNRVESVIKLSGKSNFKLTIDTGQIFENDYSNYKSVTEYGQRRITGVCLPI